MGAQTAAGLEPFLDLVEESFDEAEFLWRSWEAALHSHARDLDGVSFWVEERLLGSLDGVRLGREYALTSLIQPGLLSEQPERATVSAHLLATASDPASTEALLGAFTELEPERYSILRRGIEVAPSPSLPELARVLLRGDAEQQAVYVEVCAFRRQDIGALARDAATSTSEKLAVAGLCALRYSPPESGAAQVTVQLGSTSPAVAAAAIETGLILGLPAAWSACRELARASAPESGRALLLLGMLGGKSEFELLLNALSDERSRNAALVALGYAGTLAAADLCVTQLGDPDSARLAAEAFCAITGLDLEEARMVEKEPSETAEPIPFEEEDLDANLVPSPESLLPLPKVSLVQRWWETNRARFRPEQRYIGGRPLTFDTLQMALECGPMRRRPSIALELSVRTQGRYSVRTDAFSSVQRAQLRTFKTLGGSNMSRSPLNHYFSRI